MSHVVVQVEKNYTDFLYYLSNKPSVSHGTYESPVLTRTTILTFIKMSHVANQMNSLVMEDVTHLVSNVMVLTSA